MPKRGSSTSGTIAVIPRKKQKNIESTNGHDHEEQDENTPLNHSSYSSQLFLKKIIITLWKKVEDSDIFVDWNLQHNINFFWIGSFICKRISKAISLHLLERINYILTIIEIVHISLQMPHRYNLQDKSKKFIFNKSLYSF